MIKYSIKIQKTLFGHKFAFSLETLFNRLISIQEKFESQFLCNEVAIIIAYTLKALWCFDVLRECLQAYYPVYIALGFEKGLLQLLFAVISSLIMDIFDINYLYCPRILSC